MDACVHAFLQTGLKTQECLIFKLW